MSALNEQGLSVGVSHDKPPKTLNPFADSSSAHDSDDVELFCPSCSAPYSDVGCNCGCPSPQSMPLDPSQDQESSSSESEDYAKRAASPYLCLLCPVGFVHNPPLLNKPNLIRHLRNVHRNDVIPAEYLSGLDLFRCEACAGVFSRSGLRSHRCMPELIVAGSESDEEEPPESGRSRSVSPAQQFPLDGEGVLPSL